MASRIELPLRLVVLPGGRVHLSLRLPPASSGRAFLEWEVQQLVAHKPPGLMHAELLPDGPRMVLDADGEAVEGPLCGPPYQVLLRIQRPRSGVYWSEGGLVVRLLCGEGYPASPPEVRFEALLHHFFLDDLGGLPDLFYEVMQDLAEAERRGASRLPLPPRGQPTRRRGRRGRGRSGRRGGRGRARGGAQPRGRVQWRCGGRDTLLASRHAAHAPLPAASAAPPVRRLPAGRPPPSLGGPPPSLGPSPTPGRRPSLKPVCLTGGCSCPGAALRLLRLAAPGSRRRHRAVPAPPPPPLPLRHRRPLEKGVAECRRTRGARVARRRRGPALALGGGVAGGVCLSAAAGGVLCDARGGGGWLRSSLQSARDPAQAPRRTNAARWTATSPPGSRRPGPTR
mmetsp:Transcript_16603/g.47966  ORF Transcript_16603/g.47966 Transcript_16603/m.47966 type:complete len:397 (+) Transcript_16603:126-1316(+)